MKVGFFYTWALGCNQAGVDMFDEWRASEPSLPLCLQVDRLKTWALGAMVSAYDSSAMLGTATSLLREGTKVDGLRMCASSCINGV